MQSGIAFCVILTKKFEKICILHNMLEGKYVFQHGKWGTNEPWKDQNKVQPFLANFLPLWITFCLIVVETWYLQILATYMSTIWKRVKSTSTPFKSTYIPLFVNHGGEKWQMFCLKFYPKVDKKVKILSTWTFGFPRAQKHSNYSFFTFLGM